MSHHHHHHGHHKRQENLAWFGLVIVLVILAFVGLALWFDNSAPVNPPHDQSPPVVTSEPPTPPADYPPVVYPPVENQTPAVKPPAKHRHKRHHHAKHYSAPRCDSTIPGYDSDGIVVAIPNPDCP